MTACKFGNQVRIAELCRKGQLVSKVTGEVLPSPERAGPDTEGGLTGLEGKSDIMPCNLFLWFSEPEKGDTKHPVMQRDVK